MILLQMMKFKRPPSPPRLLGRNGSNCDVIWTKTCPFWRCERVSWFGVCCFEGNDASVRLWIPMFIVVRFPPLSLPGTATLWSRRHRTSNIIQHASWSRRSQVSFSMMVVKVVVLLCSFAVARRGNGVCVALCCRFLNKCLLLSIFIDIYRYSCSAVCDIDIYWWIIDILLYYR